MTKYKLSELVKWPEERKPSDCKYGKEVGHGCECYGHNAALAECDKEIEISEEKIFQWLDEIFLLTTKMPIARRNEILRQHAKAIAQNLKRFICQKSN